MDFDEDISLRPLAGGAYEGRIGSGWWTPRGPLGGFVMALVLRALEEAVSDPARPPRSLTVQFLRPPSEGPVAIAPAIERSGRGLTNASARLEQEGRLLALALATFAGPWPGPTLDEAQMPRVEAAEAESERELPADAPAFLERLTMQPRFGAAPFTSADSAEVGGWLGLREDRPVDAAAVAVLADSWFPAPWPRLKALAPAPTVEMSLLFRAPLPLSGPLVLGRFRSRLVRDGFFDEDGELWAPDGALVAQSRQLGILIGAEV
jgi:acyl-CoA thioesterase